MERFKSLVSFWHKSTGGYAGPALAADAFWYGYLRDHPEDPRATSEEILLAHKALLRGIKALHMANEITGKKGVIARSIARRDLPGDGYSVKTIPLFDKHKNPLPIEKNNGTWREDNSPAKKYPQFVWEDSISRDMMLGWIAAYGAIWEVIANDSTFENSLKKEMQEDLLAIGRSLIAKNPMSDGVDNSYDLQIMDADGRATYNGNLHEDFVDRTYLPFYKNATNALLALGILSTVATITKDQAIQQFIDYNLLVQRNYLAMIHDYLVLDADNIPIINWFVSTKYSGYNMAFLGAWLAVRYWSSSKENIVLRRAIDESLYNKRNHKNQPISQAMPFYDFVFAYAMNDHSARARGLSTLAQYPQQFTWNTPRVKCEEIHERFICITGDGFTIPSTYKKDNKIYSKTPLPLQYRAPTTYLWNANPFLVENFEYPNGNSLIAPSDYRFAYWLSRWAF